MRRGGSRIFYCAVQGEEEENAVSGSGSSSSAESGSRSSSDADSAVRAAIALTAPHLPAFVTCPCGGQSHRAPTVCLCRLWPQCEIVATVRGRLWPQCEIVATVQIVATVRGLCLHANELPHLQQHITA